MLWPSTYTTPAACYSLLLSSLLSLTLDLPNTRGRSAQIGGKPRNDEGCCMQTGEETDRMEASPVFILVNPAEAAGIISDL
jgi:hypothetical protein